MDRDETIDRLYSDESLTDNLDDSDAEELLSWAESHLASGGDRDGERLIDAIRLVNRYVKEGEPFEGLFVALRANTLRTETEDLSIPRTAIDPDIANTYPDDDASEEKG
jgi:hypothetical protein